MKGELFLGHHGTSEFRLPLDAVTQTFAVLAKKGAGKTYLAGVMEEELAKHRIQFVVIDSMSAHYGIKEKYPVVVFGGPSADVPISPDIGAEIAEAILGDGFSAILKVRERETFHAGTTPKVGELRKLSVVRVDAAALTERFKDLIQQRTEEKDRVRTLEREVTRLRTQLEKAEQEADLTASLQKALKAVAKEGATPARIKMETIGGLSDRQRRMLSWLEAYAQPASIVELAARLGNDISRRGAARAEWSKDMSVLVNHGFVYKHPGKKGFKAKLRKKIDDDLAYYKATPDEGEQVYQAVIHRLAQ